MLHAYRKRQKKRFAMDQEVTVMRSIANNKGYEDDDHRAADIVMFLFAGLYPTSYSLAWTLLELARNKSEMGELREALNGNDDFLAHTKLKDILREGMRLHPVVPTSGVRTVRKDFFINVNNAMVIPKGSQVIFPSIVLTRHNIEDAEEFRPNRWRDNPDKSFLPFSAGHRNCVAQGLALAEMTWVLSRMCAEYELEISDEGETVVFCATTKCIGTRLKATRTKGDMNTKRYSV
jgi:cytochrome P450